VLKEDLLDIMERSPELAAMTGEPCAVMFLHPHSLHTSGQNLSLHIPNTRPDCVRSTIFAPLKLSDVAILAAGQVST